jgi:hypothetical protein
MPYLWPWQEVDRAILVCKSQWSWALSYSVSFHSWWRLWIRTCTFIRVMTSGVFVFETSLKARVSGLLEDTRCYTDRNHWGPPWTLLSTNNIVVGRLGDINLAAWSYWFQVTPRTLWIPHIDLSGTDNNQALSKFLFGVTFASKAKQSISDL